MLERDIDVRAYSRDIQRLLQRYGLPPETVLFVADITEWCREHAPEFANDIGDRVGKTLYRQPPNPPLILLREMITPDMVSEVLGGLLARGFIEARNLYDDERSFAIHVILHEIAHVLDRDRSEEDCDQWVFQQL